MVTILALSKKRKLNILPRIKKEEFIIDTFKAKLQAKDNSLVDGILADGDPSEIRIAANEMAFSLYSGNLAKGLYWMNWILEWEKINTKKYGKYECAARIIEGVDSKYYKDVVWLIWAVINKLRILKFLITGTSISSQMDYLWKMYCYKFTSGARPRKVSLMIWALLYLTENVDMSVQLVDKPHVLFQSLLGMDKIASSLKSQEVHHVVNNDLLNVVVENNYMMPANYKQLESEKAKRSQELVRQQQAQSAVKADAAKNKASDANQLSIQKLNDVYKLDRMMYA
jgi:hypothetical protein